MNTLNFDNIECSIYLFIGCTLGFLTASVIRWHSEEKYIETIEEYKRKNAKLIYFIRYKLGHYVHDFEDEGESHEE